MQTISSSSSMGGYADKTTHSRIYSQTNNGIPADASIPMWQIRLVMIPVAVMGGYALITYLSEIGII